MEEQKLIRNLLLGLMLAAVCVGTAELVACRVMDPALYEQVVEPVRLLYHEKRSQVKGLSEQYDQWLSDQREIRAERAAQQIRRAEERRLLRRMIQDQRELFAYLEAHPFVYVPPSDPTELITRDGQEYLTGGNLERLVYYNQADERWSGELFGIDPIGGYGCGPTALSMVVSSLTGQSADPAEVAAWAASQGYAAPGSGSYYPIVRGVAEHYGLTCDSVDLTPEALGQALSTGGLVVALMGPGHFTAHGHFIVLHGVTEDGRVLAADPNSRENSVELWDPEVIVSELSSTRASGAPLWLVRAP